MRFYIITALFSLMPLMSSACPKISGIADYHCNQDLKIVVMGDSLAYGFGDLKNDNSGGYVTRLARRFPAISFTNLGEQGLKSQQHLLKLQRAFRGEESDLTLKALLSATYVIQDLGRNDRWDFGLPSATFRNLRRAATLIRTKVAEAGAEPPLVITAVMMLPNRGSQGPWVKELNEIIFKSSSAKFPADLRFDLVSKRLLSSDQIHPTSLGYDALASALSKYLTTTLSKTVARLLPDSDADRIYDSYEVSKFGTDPTLADTDGDGKEDGAEIFTLKTNPLVAD